MFRGNVHRIHFVGIGGAGMSGIAEVLLTQGYAVTGSDLKEGAAVRRLRELGGVIHVGHDPTYVVGVDVVVKSTAIPSHNIEIRAADRLQIPVIPRAEMLGELMRMKYGVAVAGSHGKTTTTSMMARCLHQGGLDPTIVIGGRLDAIGSSARLGAGEYIVAEADESDGSFLQLDPTVAVVTNIDPEHMEHWGTMEALLAGFAEFANKVPFYGFVTLCLDNPNVQRLIPRINRRFLTYGLNRQAEIHAVERKTDGISARFTVARGRDHLGDIHLKMPGDHNVSNALAAVATSLELGISFSDIQEALEGFTGVDRRFSLRAEISVGDGDPVTIIDDYGHHPTEIAATLQGARAAWPRRRIHAVFQPHRYTRVRDLLEEFSGSFHQAEHVMVCPVYAAGEKPIPGLDQARIAQAIRDHGHRGVTVVADLDQAAAQLAAQVEPGDVVITLGAGDVNRVCADLEEALRAS